LGRGHGGENPRQDGLPGPHGQRADLQKSYKAKQTQEKDRSKWIITESTHEPIVDKEIWERVQKLREATKRKKTKRGDMGPLNGLLYCYDCGKKLRIQRDVNTKKEYYICSTYASSRTGHRECSMHCTPRHFIEPVILGEIQRVTAFAREREAEFVALVEKNHERAANTELRSMRAELEKAKRRVSELDVIIQKIYEDNVAGRLLNERFDTMYAGYEAEQAQLKSRMAELTSLMDIEKEKGESVNRFLGLVRRYTDVSELTAEIVRIFIDRIVVHHALGYGKARTQQLDIYYNFIGFLKEE